MNRHRELSENGRVCVRSDQQKTTAEGGDGPDVNRRRPTVDVPTGLLDSSGWCWAVADAAGGIVSTNEKWESVFGAPPGGSAPQPIWEFLSHGSGPLQSVVQEGLRKLEVGETVHLGNSRLVKDDELQWCLAWTCTRTSAPDSDECRYLVAGRDLTDEVRLRESLKAAERDLAGSRTELHRKATALKEVIAAVEDEKEAIAGVYEHNISRVVEPLLQQLKDRCGESEQHSLDVLESCLKSVLSPSVATLERICPTLTAREVQICNMIKQGFSTKQIASVLVLSTQTVQTHRKNIRRKLGLLSKRVSLEKSLHQLERDAADKGGKK